MQKKFTHAAIMVSRYSILVFCIIAISSPFLTAKDGYSQDLNTKTIYLAFDAGRKPLGEALHEIENKTQCRFFYDASRFDIRQQVKVPTQRTSLYDILQDIATETKLEFKQIGNYFSIRYPKEDLSAGLPDIAPLAAGYTALTVNEIPAGDLKSYMPADTLLKGKVTDEKGEPLAGVTIRQKGKTGGTVTDATGHFSFHTTTDAVLEFSYIGYEKKEVPAEDIIRSGVISIAPNASGLNEVIVVGYGTQQKQDITSSVSTVSGDEIRETPAVNLQNGLNGKLPGLFSQQRSGQPGSESAAAIYIRGVSTFSGDASPLVLVDDVEYPYDQLYLIDPNEVGSISILKDAAATSIYGIKGANGVILITTRRGQTGKPVIHLISNLGIQSPVHVLKTLDAYQSAILQNEADQNDGLPLMFTDEDIALFKSGKDPYGHPNVDWYHTLFKPNTLITTNNLDISGGSERVKYFITLGYMFQNGLIRDIPYNGPDQVASGKTQVNTNFNSERYKFRSNLDIQATRSLHLQLDMTGTRQSASRPQFATGFSTLFRYDVNAPFMMPVYNPDGSFGYANPNWMVPPNSSPNMASAYALAGYVKAINDFMNFHLSATQGLDDLTQGLSLKADVAYSFEDSAASRTLTRYNNVPNYWYDTETGIYHPRDPTLIVIPPYQLVYDGGTLIRQLSLRGSLNYDRTFGPHNVSGLVMFSETSQMREADAPVNFRGYTFRFTYNFRHKYLFGLSGAYNGTSRFITQKRYQLFPAVSAGWNLVGEPFFTKALPFIEAFKIRGSYGWVGDDKIPSGYQYLYEQRYDRTGNYSLGEYDNTINSIVEGTQGNTDVTWQTERKADIGFDFSLFKGKISGSFDYFDNYRYNILTKRSTIPGYFGVVADNLPPVNIGKVGNKGYEIEITYNGNAGPVQFNVKGDFSFAKNKILFMDEPPPKYPWEQQTGRSIGMTRQWTWLGFYQNQKDIDTSAVPPSTVKPGYLKYKDLNGDGIIDNDDKAFMGYPNLPNTNIGLTLGLNYKGISFSILLQTALRFDVYMGNGNAVPFKTDLQPLHLGRWTPETAATATFPTLTTTFNGSYMNPDNRSTFWTTRGDYLRIRSLYLAYALPGRIIKKAGLAGAQIYMNGYDLFTWSKFLKRWQFDPEVDSGSGGYIYPTQKILNFGINLTF